MTSRSNRELALGAGAFLAILISGGALAKSDRASMDRLIADYAEANAALMRGDADSWERLSPMSEDFVLMSPFGGEPSRFADYPPERIQRMGKFFRNGTFDHELVQAYATSDMAVLVTIERSNVEVGGLAAKDWALRVTSVFKRGERGWKLAHRHASPLVHPVSLDEAAALASGTRK
jgi:ketosteroid isomerase-like protein